MRFNVRKELFPRLTGIVSLGKNHFIFLEKTKKSNRNEILDFFLLTNVLLQKIKTVLFRNKIMFSV